MIPQVARRLIRLYGTAGGALLDPFCGSGTSLVEARLAGIHVVGIDINPFAVFLARTKTRLYSPEQIAHEARCLRNALQNGTPAESAPIPQFFNIDYWFKKEVQQDLARLKYAIASNVAPEVQDFFWVAFAHTVRECSNTRKSEYKLYRIDSQKLPDYNPDVFKTFWEKVSRNLRGLWEFVQEARPQAQVSVIHGDVRLPQPIDSDSIDLIVTSPPYGDSQTTVAYGQFSRLALQWLGLDDEEAKRIDRISLGGQVRFPAVEYRSTTLDETLERIGARDTKRAKQVRQFYDDFAVCFPQLTHVCRQGAYAGFVVGNRTVKGIRIPTDQILTEIAECFGWRYCATYHRRIPNKRMPLRNSPSNKPGELCETMTEEHIVVLQKET